MGRLLADALGADYRTVSMIARSGEILYFGEEDSLTADSPLQRSTVDPDWATDLERVLAGLTRGSFLLRLGDGGTGPRSRAWLEARSFDLASAPDVAVVVDSVKPIELP